MPDPPTAVTEILTVPAVCAGEVATSWVLDLTVKDSAAVVPNSTALTVVKLAPVTVTWVPPDDGPLVLERDVIVGGGT